MTDPRPPKGVLLGEWEPKNALIENDIELYVTQSYVGLGMASVVSGILTRKECRNLIEQFEATEKFPVGLDGYSNGDPSKAGSVRATAWSPEIAECLFERLSHVLPQHRHMTALTPTDWFGTEERREYDDWTLEGISPVLRFMKYTNGGSHRTHYDCGYDYGDGRRTLMSFVIYLNSVASEDGGTTRFIYDGQDDIDAEYRDYSDWDVEADEDQVLARIQPRAGSVLIFDHRQAHDVEKLNSPDARYIIRGDVIYKAIE